MGESPEFNEEPSRDGDDTDGSHATATVREATFEPTGEFGIRLEPDPTPGDLYGHGADARRSGLGDAEVTDLISAVVGRGREASECSDLATALDVAPGKELEGEEPSRLKTDALEGHELADDGDGRIGRVLELVELKALDEPDAFGDTCAVGPLA